MNKIYSYSKYIALAFFSILLVLSTYKKLNLIAYSDFVPGVIYNSKVVIKKEKDIIVTKGIYFHEYDQNEEVNVFYDKNTNTSTVFELDYFLRDTLILFFIIGLIGYSIFLDKKEKS